MWKGIAADRVFSIVIAISIRNTHDHEWNMETVIQKTVDSECQDDPAHAFGGMGSTANMA